MITSPHGSARSSLELSCRRIIAKLFTTGLVAQGTHWAPRPPRHCDSKLPPQQPELAVVGNASGHLCTRSDRSDGRQYPGWPIRFRIRVPLTLQRTPTGTQGSEPHQSSRRPHTPLAQAPSRAFRGLSAELGAAATSSSTAIGLVCVGRAGRTAEPDDSLLSYPAAQQSPAGLLAARHLSTQ